MFVNKNIIKKIISGIVLSCLVSIPSIHLANEHENTQEKKQTKYDMAKNLFKSAAQGYGTYLSASVAHEFGHWLTGKIIYKNYNGFFVVHPNGTGTTYHYRNRTTKHIIKKILITEYLNKDYTSEPPLVMPEKQHPLVIAAGPLFGIGYSLLAQRSALQSNMFLKALGAQFSLILNIKQLSPFHPENDGSRILQCFNINCPSPTGEMVCKLVAGSAALMLGIWSINGAVLPQHNF